MTTRRMEEEEEKKVVKVRVVCCVRQWCGVKLWARALSDRTAQRALCGAVHGKYVMRRPNMQVSAHDGGVAQLRKCRLQN